jgi:hypothetical protein
MASFERAGKEVQISLDLFEARVLRGLLDEMARLLQQEESIEDAVVDRLFPAAYAAPEDAQAFAELVGEELRDGKIAAVSSIAAALAGEGPIVARVPRDRIDEWLTVLTDLRLALGTRLEVTEEKMEEQLDPGDPAAAGMSVLHWLGWLQEMLIEIATEENR